MSHRSRGQQLAAALVAIFLSAILLSFQNCSSPMSGGLFDQKSVSDLAQSAPFAYDTTIDQMAYMSCSDMDTGFDASTYFTIKAGAYWSGGVKLNQAARNFVVQLPKTTKPDEVISASPINNAVAAQLDFRSRANLGVRAPLNGVGNNYSYLTDDLSSSVVSNILLQIPAGQRVQIFPALSGARPKPVEAVFQFNASAGSAQAFRDLFSMGNFLMTLVHTSAGSAGNGAPVTPVGAPGSVAPKGVSATASQTVYGRGFNLGFGSPESTNWAGGNRVLTSVNETNLNLYTNDGDPPSSWNCPANLRLRVVRPEDAAAQACQLSLTDPPNPDINLQRWRKMLGFDQWYIDLVHQCAVPKNSVAGLCYGSLAPSVSYNLSSFCVTGNVSLSNGNIDNTSPRCAHFISLCYR